MNILASINFLNFSFETRTVLVIVILIFNLILYILFRKKDIKNKLFHKVLSVINIFAELFIFTICLYQFHSLFIIFAPFLIAFITFIGYGINAKLTKEEKMTLTIIEKTTFLLHGKIKEKMGEKIKERYPEFIFFPGYYLIESWRK